MDKESWVVFGVIIILAVMVLLWPIFNPPKNVPTGQGLVVRIDSNGDLTVEDEKGVRIEPIKLDPANLVGDMISRSKVKRVERAGTSFIISFEKSSPGCVCFGSGHQGWCNPSGCGG